MKYSRDRPIRRKKKTYTLIAAILCMVMLIGVGSSFFKISYLEISDSFEVNNKPSLRTVKKIEIDEKSFSKVILQGEKADFSTLKANVTFGNGQTLSYSLSKGEIILLNNVDSTILGPKEFSVSCGGVVGTSTVYVADASGVSSVVVSDVGKTYYTDAESLKLYEYGKNIISPDYAGNVKTNKDYPTNTIVGLEDGRLSVSTDGSISNNFSFILYKGAPIIPCGENNKVRISLDADFEKGSYLKVNFWKEYGVDNAKQIIVRPGKAIDFDLSDLTDVTYWDISFYVSPSQAINGICSPRIDIIPEISNDGEIYNVSDIENLLPMDIGTVKILTPDLNGIFDTNPYTNGVIYAFGGKIHFMK